MSDFSAALRRLHATHNIRPVYQAVHAADVACAQVVTGVCSSSRMWPERVQVKAFAYGRPLPASVPLLYRHREPAGEVLELRYSEAGELCVTARIDLPAAWTCNAFSVGMGRVDVEWMNLEDPRTFHALITRVHSIEEISVTPIPRDAGARVQSRRAVNGYDKCLRELQRIKTLLQAA